MEFVSCDIYWLISKCSAAIYQDVYIVTQLDVACHRLGIKNKNLIVVGAIFVCNLNMSTVKIKLPII